MDCEIRSKCQIQSQFTTQRAKELLGLTSEGLVNTRAGSFLDTKESADTLIGSLLCPIDVNADRNLISLGKQGRKIQEMISDSQTYARIVINDITYVRHRKM